MSLALRSKARHQQFENTTRWRGTHPTPAEGVARYTVAARYAAAFGSISGGGSGTSWRRALVVTGSFGSTHGGRSGTPTRLSLTVTGSCDGTNEGRSGTPRRFPLTVTS